MRFLKHSLLLAALSLTFISCGDDNDDYLYDPPLEPPAITDVSFISSDYILNAVHKSYYNPFFKEGDSPYYNHAYGLTFLLKLNKASYLDIISRLKLFAGSGADTLSYEFNKYQLHDMFSDTMGGYVLVIDSLFVQSKSGYYPSEEYEWTIHLYDDKGAMAPAFTKTTKTDSYIYDDSVSAVWQNSGSLTINFSAPSSYVSSRKAQVFLFDSQKKYLKYYPYEDINGASHSVTLNDIPAGAAYYRAEIGEVYYGVKRTYTGKFEAMPERL